MKGKLLILALLIVMTVMACTPQEITEDNSQVGEERENLTPSPDEPAAEDTAPDIAPQDLPAKESAISEQDLASLRQGIEEMEAEDLGGLSNN